MCGVLVAYKKMSFDKLARKIKRMQESGHFVPRCPTDKEHALFSSPRNARNVLVLDSNIYIHKKRNTHRGARTHDHKVKGLALCRLS